jgi:hypothetical protein
MRNLILQPIGLLVLLLTGCPVMHEPVGPAAAPASDSPSGADSERQGDSTLQSPQSIGELVQATLDRNLRQRQLSVETHGAWQVLHGILAYGEAFDVQTPQGVTPALRYLLSGNRCAGFEPTAGDELGQPPRRGLRMTMEPSTKIGQGHRDQWLAVISQCGLPVDTAIQGVGESFTLADWIRQAEYDVPRNLELEFSWTLIALTAYQPTDYRWIARDGVEYSTEDLLYSELQQSLESSVCGGTHRLIGIAMALGKRKQEGKPITGVWAEAEKVIQLALEDAKQNQNADGSYSPAYLHRTGWTRDLGESLGTTGHVLEFVAFAGSDETLTQPWVQRSVRRLCEVLEQCQEVELECGVLYHALHGLSEYQRRLQQIQAPS